MKILTVIPAFNEEKCIYEVIESIKALNIGVDILVVNDGSSDGTYLEAVRAGARVINLPLNLGIGGAVQTGYIYACERGYDIVIQIDGDGQHDPADISRLVKLIEDGSADMVIGSRFVEDTKYIPGSVRRVGISFFSRLVSRLCGKSYYDTTSGYRAVNKKVIKLFSCYYPKDYPEVETIVYASNRGIRIREIPVEMRKRQGGRSSITPVKSIYYMLKVTFALLFQPENEVIS